jgi:hypothetical protein
MPVYRFTILLLVLTASSVIAGPNDSQDFDARGVVVDIPTFFAAAEGVVTDTASPANMALVTEEGVFAFLETPENEEQLRKTESGSVVRVRGKLLKRGALLHVDQLDLLTTVPLIDFAKFRADPGQQVHLAGVNKCQCGLAVADLPHSCKLGHLHHLEAEDGKIYHYLQTEPGRQAFLGRGSHSQPVAVTALLLPGQFLMVQQVDVITQ